MPNLNHRLSSAFFPIFSSQKSAFFPPFLSPNPNGRLDLKWQNTRNTARRVALRTMGFLVALFSATRANAVAYNSACPNCSDYNGAICEKKTAYSGSGVIGYNAVCIPSSTSPSPAITSASCVAKLQAWGMCKDGMAGLGRLHNSGLNCYGTTGPSAGGNFAGTSISSLYGTYYYNRAVSGSLEYISIGTGTGVGGTYTTACCLASGASINACCFTRGSCENYWNCGICDAGQITTNITVNGMSSGSTESCNYDFYTYFKDNRSTGWCGSGTSGNIYVEGTGALLIAHECFGTTSISSASGLASQCGVIVESCDASAGYYRTNTPNYPLTFFAAGADAFCATCPDVSQNNLDFTYNSGLLSSYVSSAGSGITSCWAKPTQNPTTYTDSKGTVQVTFSSDCQYTE